MIKSCLTQKAIILSAVLPAMCLLFTGCGGKSIFDGIRTSGGTEFRMEYSILDKEESAEMKLTEGDQVQVHISHTAGNADVIVGQENADFILTIPKTGCCIFSVAGHRAKGDIFYLHPVERGMKEIWQTQ